MLNGITQRIRPAWCHREESNLTQRPSQCRAPSLERWQANNGRGRSQPMESNHHVRGYGPRRCPARAAKRAPGAHGIRGGNRTRVAGSRDRSTDCCTTRTRPTNPPAPLQASVTGIEPALPVGKTGVLGHCTTRTNRPTQETTVIVTIINAFRPVETSRRGIGWVRTNVHPVNNRPLNQLSFDPRYRRVATPAAVAGPRLRTAV